MPEIGVRELKVHASEIVRAVRDARARYIITYRGHPVGVLDSGGGSLWRRARDAKLGRS